MNKIIMRTLVGIFLTVAAAAHAFNWSGKLPTVGKPAPNFELIAFDGRKIQLAARRQPRAPCKLTEILVESQEHARIF